MKKAISLLLSVMILFTLVPLTANAAAESPASPETSCLESDKPHGEAIWTAVSELEKALPENAAAGDYIPLVVQVEEIVRSSDEVKPGSVENTGDALYWSTLDGMAHVYSPVLREQIRNREPAELSSAQTPLHNVMKEEPELLGAATDELTGFGSTTAKSVAVFAPYYGYEGDNWGDDEPLASAIAKKTGGSYNVYFNGSASVDKLADALETCAVVIMDTHGAVDKSGSMYDTSMSNTSYLTLTTGSGITSTDCEWLTGSCGRYAHAFDSGADDDANGNHVYYVDGTAIANHMDRYAPNNLFWMDSCFTMSTDGLAAPLYEKGVGVLLGYSKPVCCAGGDMYKKLFFDSLISGETVSNSASYMKKMAGSSWDPFYKVSESAAVAAGIAFPIFVTEQDPYPGQNKVDAVQPVMSQWRLPFKDESDYGTDEALLNGQLQRVDCRFRFNPDLTGVTLDSGSLPPGMILYWTPREMYVRGTPSSKGTYNAFFKVTDKVYGTMTYRVTLYVTDPSKEATTDITFNASKTYDKTIRSGVYYARLVSGYLPRRTTIELTGGDLRFSAKTEAPPGEYKVVYDVVDSSANRYRQTVTVKINPQSSATYSDRTVTMARGCKGVVPIIETNKAFYNVEITKGAIPDGTMLVSRNSKNFNIIGTPTASGTYNATVRLTRDARYYTLNLKVVVKEPKYVDATINRYDVYGTRYGSGTESCGNTYTLPDYNRTLPDNQEFSGWFYNGQMYQPGAKLNVDTLRMDIYACCRYKTNTVISDASCTISRPVDGQQPDRRPVSGDFSRYSVKLSSWSLNEAPYTQITGNNTFSYGKQYSVSVTFTPKPGYTFDSSTNFTINGAKPAAVSGNTVIAVYTAEDPTVRTVDCYLDAPVGGKTPDTTAIPKFAGYTADVSYWYVNQKPDYTHLTATDVFSGQNSYRVRVRYTPKDGCVFNSDTKFYIGGRAATSVGGNTYEVVYTAITPITSVRLSGTPQAVAGTSASANPPVYQPINSPHYTIASAGWSRLIITSVKPLKYHYADFTGSFAEESIYYPTLTLKPNTNYQFSENGVTVIFDGGETRDGVLQSDGTLFVRCPSVASQSAGLRGDVDLNGVVDVTDATLVQMYAAQRYTLTGQAAKNADYDGNGVIDVTDATLIQMHAAGM